MEFLLRIYNGILMVAGANSCNGHLFIEDLLNSPDFQVGEMAYPGSHTGVKNLMLKNYAPHTTSLSEPGDMIRKMNHVLIGRSFQCESFENEKRCFDYAQQPKKIKIELDIPWLNKKH